MSRIESIVERMSAARQYTQSLLDETGRDDWFRMPSGDVTHIAWQVGHMAAAEYFLALLRIRGKKEEDAQLIPEEFMSLFGRGSTPNPDESAYPAVDDIQQVFDRVHHQAIEEVGGLSDNTLDEPVDTPHPMFSTKLGSLLFCPAHELLHAGQIGLLRRLFGNAPLR